MKRVIAGLLLLTVIVVAATPAAAETIIAPDSIDEITSDAETLSLTAAVEGEADSYSLNGTLGGCELPAVAVLANEPTAVSFKLAGCELTEGEADLVLTASGAKDTTVTVPVGAADPDRDIGEALRRSGFWALGAFLVVLVSAALWAWRGWDGAGDPADTELEPKRLRPENNAKATWMIPLPGAPIEDLDWTGGIAGKLVFVGAAVTAVLGASELLDSVLTDGEATLLTAAVVLAALLAGIAPLVLAGLQADFVAAVRDPPKTGAFVVVGDRVPVASVIGVVLAAAITAAAVTVELVALRDAVDYIELRGRWTEIGIGLLGVAVALYCVSVAGSVTRYGRYAALIDDPFAEPGAEVEADGSTRRSIVPPAEPSMVRRRSRRAATKATVLLP